MRQHLERRMQTLDLLAHRLVHPAEQLARTRQRLAHLATQLGAALHTNLHRRQTEVAAVRLRLARRQPNTAAAQASLAAAGQRLRQAATATVAVRRAHLDRIGAELAALNPAATLQRGYSIVRDATGSIVSDGAALTEGAAISLRFANGGGEAVVIKAFPD
jgi:exodeoxyribonuclease VII large subunit